MSAKPHRPSSVEVSSGGRSITVTVPLAFVKRGGRKVILAPDDAPAWVPRIAILDNSLVHALARGHRWRRMIEKGAFNSATAIAAAEGVSHSFVSRILRLTLLAPDLIEAILDGRQSPALHSEGLKASIPLSWDVQRAKFGR